ncbi:MAG TPA: hypothetical protein VIM34_18380 [Burkholderiaceae bacterium]
MTKLLKKLESVRVVHSGAGADLMNDPTVREAYLGLGVEPMESTS